VDAARFGVASTLLCIGPALAFLIAPPTATKPAAPPSAGVLDPGKTPQPDHSGPVGTLPDELDPGDRAVEPCTSATNCPQTDVDLDGVPDMWEDVLAVKYAPEVRLPPSNEDWTRPSSVDWYLARAHLRFEHDNCSDCPIMSVGSVTQQNLWKQTHRWKT